MNDGEILRKNQSIACGWSIIGGGIRYRLVPGLMMSHGEMCGEQAEQVLRAGRASWWFSWHLY